MKRKFKQRRQEKRELFVFVNNFLKVVSLIIKNVTKMVMTS